MATEFVIRGNEEDSNKWVEFWLETDGAGVSLMARVSGSDF